MARSPNISRQQRDLLFTLFNEIGIVNQLASHRFERALPHNLTTSQFSVLNNFVRLGGDRSPKQLADAFQVTKAAMTNTLGKLEQKGFVRISADPADGRAKRVTITEAGKQAREEGIAAAAVAMSDLTEVVSKDVALALLPDLQRIRVWLDEHRGED